MRVMIVGSGLAATMHLAALDPAAAATVVGVVDLDPERARTTAVRNGGLEWDTDLERAIRAWQIDAAIVCTPSDTHLQVGSILAENGIHVLMEKPLAATSGEAEQLAGMFASRDLVLSAAHVHRFGAYARTIKQLLGPGTEVGPPRHLRVSILNGWVWSDWRGWQLQRSRTGGHAVHNGVHVLDLATWWIGDQPTHVHASGRRQAAAELEIHDYFVITLAFGTGATAVCEFSRANQPRVSPHRDVVILGQHGLAHVPWDGEGLRLHREDRSGSGSVLPYEFRAQFDSWIGAILGQSSATVSAREGVRAVRVAEAAETSMATGAIVQLDPTMSQSSPR